MIAVLVLIAIILIILSSIPLVLDKYNLFGFKITNKAVETILLLVFGICSLFLLVTDIFDIAKMV
jgi:hypothetical protein